MVNPATDNSEEEMRFSDEKLYQFHTEFRVHVERCEERFNDGDQQLEQLIEAQQRNTDSITLLVNETRAIVQLYKDVQGATRVGKGFQSFLSWVVKWPLVGTGVYAAINWIIKHLP